MWRHILLHLIFFFPPLCLQNIPLQCSICVSPLTLNDSEMTAHYPICQQLPRHLAAAFAPITVQSNETVRECCASFPPRGGWQISEMTSFCGNSDTFVSDGPPERATHSVTEDSRRLWSRLNISVISGDSRHCCLEKMFPSS